MTTHCSILACRIPWTEEPGGHSPRGRKESDTTERLGTACSSTWFNAYVRMELHFFFLGQKLMKGNVTSLGMHSEMPSPVPRGQHVNLTRPSGLQGGHVNGEEGRSSWRASHTPPARPALCHWEPLPGPPTGGGSTWTLSLLARGHRTHTAVQSRCPRSPSPA